MPITPERSRIMARWLMERASPDRYTEVQEALVEHKGDPDYDQWTALTYAERREAIALDRQRKAQGDRTGL